MPQPGRQTDVQTRDGNQMDDAAIPELLPLLWADRLLLAKDQRHQKRRLRQGTQHRFGLRQPALTPIRRLE